MVTVIKINDKEENIGFVSIRCDNGNVYIHSSPLVPLTKSDVKKIIDTLQKNLATLKDQKDER